MNMRNDPCPPREDLSALFDGEAGEATPRLQRHVGACPACASTLLAFSTLHGRLEPLRASTSDLGVAEAVLMRLPRRPPPRRAFGLRWASAPHFGVRALGGAAALAAGLALGLSVVTGGAVAERTGMSVFSAEPAGRICAGLPGCATRGR